MVLALPGFQALFSHMQEELLHFNGGRVNLTNGAHQSLVYLHCLAKDLERRLNRLYKLVPIHPNLDEYHDAYGYMCGIGFLPGPTEVPQTL